MNTLAIPRVGPAPSRKRIMRMRLCRTEKNRYGALRLRYYYIPKCLDLYLNAEHYRHDTETAAFCDWLLDKPQLAKRELIERAFASIT